MDTRLASAVTSRACSPCIRRPLASSVRTSMSALSAGTLWREIASETTLSTSTSTDVRHAVRHPAAGTARSARLTMSPSRLASTSTFSPNRRTVSGSSAEDSSASASTRHRADRRLELVADVGHEVAPGRLHARVFGLVVDEDHGEPAIFLAEQPGLPVHRQPGPATRRLRRQQVEFDVGAVGQRPAAPPSRPRRRAAARAPDPAPWPGRCGRRRRDAGPRRRRPAASARRCVPASARR